MPSDPPADLTGQQLADLFHAHEGGLQGAIRLVLGSGCDVAEVVQEAFTRALAALDRGHQPGDPVAWVFVLTLNLSRDLRRRRRTRQGERTLEDQAMELPATEAGPHAASERHEAVAAASAAIERLVEPEKEIFLLRTSAGLSFEAAAQALGIPVGTAKTRMRMALLHLRGALAAHAPRVAVGRRATS
jgi:RNA polymerase sigma factor (sigma-70 family)